MVSYRDLSCGSCKALLQHGSVVVGSAMYLRASIDRHLQLLVSCKGQGDPGASGCSVRAAGR